MEVSYHSSTFVSQDPTSNTVNYKNYHFNRIGFVVASCSFGGLIYGYDTAIVGGANLFTDLFEGSTDFSKMNYCYLTSLFGAIFGALLIGPIADDYGRKTGIFLSNVLLLVGTFFFSIGADKGPLIFGRIMQGLGFGGTLTVIPIYLAEFSPTKLRGAIVTSNFLAISIGQFLCYLLNFLADPGWRMKMGLEALLVIIHFFLVNYCPESPHWLIKNGKGDFVKHMLKKTFQTQREDGNDELEREVADIQTCLINNTETRTLKSKYTEVLSKNRDIFVLGAGTMTIQFLCGYGSVNFYGVKLLQDIGFVESQNEDLSLICCLIYSLAICLGGFYSFIKLDQIGRRPILLRSMLGVCFSVMFLVIGTGLEKYHDSGMWISAISLYIYLVFYSSGILPYAYLLNAEIFPLGVRATGMSLSHGIFFFLNLVMTASFLILTDYSEGVLSLFVLILVTSCITIYVSAKNFPETKFKLFSEINEALTKPFELEGESLDEIRVIRTKRHPLAPPNRTESAISLSEV